MKKLTISRAFQSLFDVRVYIEVTPHPFLAHSFAATAMSRLLLRFSLLFLLALLTFGPEISSCLSSSKFERRDEDLRYGDEGDQGDDRGEDVEDRQLPGTPPELTQMFQKLLAPLMNAASLLPLGRQLPHHDGGDRNDFW